MFPFSQKHPEMSGRRETSQDAIVVAYYHIFPPGDFYLESVFLPTPRHTLLAPLALHALSQSLMGWLSGQWASQAAQSASLPRPASLDLAS